MGWGFMSGLGQGLQDVAKLPQQVYQNQRQRAMEEDALKTAALQRALSQQTIDFNTQANPKRLTQMDAETGSLNTSTDLGKTQIAAALQKAMAGIDTPLTTDQQGVLGAGHLGGLVGPGGKMLEDPYVKQNEDAELAQKRAQTGLFGAEAGRSRAEAGLTVHQGKYYDSEANLNNARANDPTQFYAGARTAALAKGSPGASMILTHFDKVGKQFDDLLKADPHFMMAPMDDDPTTGRKGKITLMRENRARAMAEAIRIAKQSGIIVTPDDIKAANADADTGAAVQGALDPGAIPLPR